MSSSRGTRVVVLGAGPAGLGAALGLARRGLAPMVLEARDAVGGNAGSFTLQGIRVDYGSHRLHPSTDPEILADLRKLLGGTLVERPRRGRIFLGGRWIPFPPSALGVALHAPPAFVGGVAADLVTGAARSLVGGALGRSAAGGEAEHGGRESFASVLLRSVGPTLCRDFYFPYARKIWGLEPEEISPAQARRRVSAASFGALLRRFAPARRGGGGSGFARSFYYPRNGFGTISEAMAEAASAAGATIHLGARVSRVRAAEGGDGMVVEVEGREGVRALACEQVWSTLPLGVLVRVAEPPPPPEVLEAATRLEQRALVLVYLVLAQDRFTGYDAHYFPSAEVPFTRVSEPKNYADRSDPAGRTVLCAEIPCTTADLVWKEDPEALGAVVMEGLARVGLPVQSPVIEVAVRRLPAAYPLYRLGWEEHFARVDGWISGRPGLLTFGRQGLHAHDNTHHALAMARAAVACLDDDGRFDEVRWARYRVEFTRHVVED